MTPHSDIVIYTAINNNYNTLRNPSYIDRSIDYVCFTDQMRWQSIVNNTVWKLRPFPKQNLDPTRMNRLVKLQPHVFFQEYKYSIYIDGNINITGDVRALLAYYRSPRMLAFKHPKRSCIYAEGDACIELKKEAPDRIINQLNYYRSQNHPENTGLIEANVLLRRHNDPSVIKLMNDWWHEVLTRSRRDQLSFPYVARRNNFWPTLMGDDNSRGNSKYFAVRDDGHHRARNLPLSKKLRTLADVYISWRFKR